MIENERFEYVTAIRDAEGNLRWESKLEESQAVSQMKHDDDVSNYSDEDVIDLTMGMLGVSEDQRSIIKIECE